MIKELIELSQRISKLVLRLYSEESTEEESIIIEELTDLKSRIRLLETIAKKTLDN